MKKWWKYYALLYVAVSLTACTTAPFISKNAPRFAGLARLNSEFNFPLEKSSARQVNPGIEFDSQFIFELKNIGGESQRGVLFRANTDQSVLYIFPVSENRYVKIEGRCDVAKIETLRRILSQEDFNSWQGAYIAKDPMFGIFYASVQQHQNCVESMFIGHYTKGYLMLEQLANEIIAEIISKGTKVQTLSASKGDHLVMTSGCP